MRFISVLFLLVPLILPAQGDVDLIWEPSATYTHKVNDFWSVASQLTAIQSSVGLERMEVSVMPLRRLSPRTTIGLGYLNRVGSPFESPSVIENRFTLQYGYQHPWRIHQVSHRFRVEERIRDGEFTHRFRYRVSLRAPIQGDRIDAGETYWLTQNEGLASFRSGDFSGENRISVHLGYLRQNLQRVEVGLQYRAESLFSRNTVGHVALFSTVWHVSN